MSGPAFGSIDGLLAQAGWLNRLARQLVRDGDVAEDVAQEVWLAAGRSPPEPGRPPRPWLAQVVRNVVRMRARSEGRRRRWEAEAGETGTASSPEAVYEQLELHRAVVECVMKLDEPLRATLLFRYFEERSSFEIARLMDVPAGTVRRRLKTALEDLRRELDRRFVTRRRWALALAPAARLAMTAAMGKGALLMAIKLKVGGVAALAALVLLIGGAAWLVHRRGGESPAASGERARARAGAREWPAEAAGRTAAAVTGLVRDAQGSPVGGATVLLAREPRPSELTGSVWRPVGAAVSDGSGRFHLSDLPPGSYVATASAAGRGPGRSLVFKLADGEAAQVIVVLGAGGHLIEGRVLDADGQSPIIGARVSAGPSSNLAATGPQPLFQSTTDAQGAYRLTLGTGEFRLRAEASGYAPHEEPVAATRAVVRDFRLRPAARISGQVRERDTGRPVAGADIRLTPLSMRAREGFRQTRTDDHGNYSFEDGDPGSYRVLARSGRLAGGGPAVHVVEAQAVTGIDILVDAMANVAGRAVDEQGRAMADARIVLASADRSAAGGATSSLADGAFRIEGVAPGTYNVRAEAATSASLFNTDPIVVLGKDVDGLKVVLHRGAAVLGTVVSADGKPVAGADVQADLPSGTKQFVRGRTTDVDGSFRIAGLSAGKFVLRVRHAEAGTASEEISLGAGQEVTVKMKLAEGGASLTGVVKRPNGAPVGGASVSVTAQDARSAYGSVTTEPDGRYTIGTLPAGRFTVWARPRGGPSSIWTSQARPDLQIVTVVAGERRTVDLTVGSGDKSVAGKVLFADGKPAAGAVVVANKEEGARSWKPDSLMLTTSATTGPDGHFVLEGLDDDVVRVWASRPGFADTEVKDVAAGRSDLVIALRAPASVAGTVVTRSGQPAAIFTVAVAGTPVAGENMGQRFRRVEQGALAPLPVHDPSGAFAIDGLDAGDYELKLTSPEGGVASQRISLSAGERKTGVRIVLEQGARVIGRVVELAGDAPIAGATIQARAAGRSFTTSTKADGTFELPNLAPTEELRLDIRVLNADTLVPEYREVAVPGGGATVDVGVVKLMKTDGPWTEPSRDGVGLGVLAKASPAGVVAGDLRPGSPADKAGIKPGDLLLAIDGHDLAKLGPGAAMYFFYGPPGSSAALNVQTPGSEPRTVTIVRNTPAKPPAK